MMIRGWWNMPCWNSLSEEQQLRLITIGNLPIDYEPEGECQNGAECEVTTMHDAAPGPRFYCYGCASDYLFIRRTDAEERRKTVLRGQDPQADGNPLLGRITDRLR